MKRLYSFRQFERLKKKKEFKRVYKEGKAVRGRNFKLIFLPNKCNFNKIGLTVPAKKIRLSSYRNRVKRLLREVYRLNKPHMKQGFDMVIIADKGASELDYKSACHEMVALYKKSGIYNETFPN